MKCRGLFGGTFDPVHNGHLHVITHCLQHISWEALHIIPCKIPVLKDQRPITATQRMDMLGLALDSIHDPRIVLDTCELDRDSPSYTITTLRDFRQHYADESLVFIMGEDAFASLPQWDEWEQLLDYAHLLIVNRSNADAYSAPLQHFITQHHRNDAAILEHTSCGHIVFLDLPTVDLSSTELRNKIIHGDAVDSLLPTQVLDYIQQHKLYRG